MVFARIGLYVATFGLSNVVTSRKEPIPIVLPQGQVHLLEAGTAQVVLPVTVGDLVGHHLVVATDQDHLRTVDHTLLPSRWLRRW